MPPPIILRRVIRIILVLALPVPFAVGFSILLFGLIKVAILTSTVFFSFLILGYWKRLASVGTVAFIALQVWALTGLVFAFLNKHLSLAVLSIFLSAFGWFIREFIAYEESRSYLSPMLHWFESKPALLPKVSCEVDGKFAGVAKIDGEGTFVVPPLHTEGRSQARRFSLSTLRFQFGDSVFQCKGSLATMDRIGQGYFFVGLSADESRDLSHFIRRLQGYGYLA